MKLSIQNIFMVVIVLAPLSVFSQISLTIDPNLKKPSREILSVAHEADVKATTQSILQAYEKYASLYDKNTRLVTSESVKRFRDLFVPDATLPPDFKEQIREAISVQEYGDEVITNLQTEGVQMKFESAILKEIKYDADGFFVSVVELEKTRYNYLGTDGEVKHTTSGKQMKQTIYMLLPEKTPTR